MLAQLNSWPVIHRELLAESRRSANYWMRVVAGGFVIAIFASMALLEEGSAGERGAVLFRILNSALSLAIFVCVPLITADCISREKREGTLGLLFLTPLRAHDIIVGKSISHGLRAVSLIFSVLPIVALPSLLGGVTWKVALQSILFHFVALIVSLSASLWASSRESEWLRAVLLAQVISGIFLFAFQVTGQQWSLSGTVLQLLIGICLFFVLFRSASLKLQNHWQESLAAPLQPKWVQIFSSSSFWQAVFRWDKAKTLDHNPIAWLQEYSWTARLTKWGWLWILFFGELYFLFAFQRMRYFDWQMRLAVILGISIAISAAWSFRRDRQTGALELLLVAPLEAKKLVQGRIWGIWCHFFPAAAVLLFLWLFNPFHRSSYQIWLAGLFLISFATVPVIGLHYALMRLPFLIAFFLTAFTGLFLPVFAGQEMTRYFWRYLGAWALGAFGVAAGIQFGFAYYCYKQVLDNLRSRRFVLEEGASRSA